MLKTTVAIVQYKTLNIECMLYDVNESYIYKQK